MMDPSMAQSLEASLVSTMAGLMEPWWGARKEDLSAMLSAVLWEAKMEPKMADHSAATKATMKEPSLAESMVNH